MYTHRSYTAADGIDRAIRIVIDDFTRGMSDEARLATNLMSVCRDNPQASWQAMALLDQLYRRRLLSSECYRRTKPLLTDVAFSSTGIYVGMSCVRPTSNAGGPATETIVASMRPTHWSQPSRSDKQPSNVVAFTGRVDVQPLRPGRCIANRYVIVEPIATSSATVTFKAVDKHREALPPSERYVAIRWLDERLQHDPHAVAALQNEYAHLQNIAHANIPKVHDLICAPGLNAIVLDWPHGHWLSDIVAYLEPHTLRVGQTLAIVREIGATLTHAHARGVVHGALRTHNVMIGSAGDLRVYDFARADAWTDSAPYMARSINPLVRRYFGVQPVPSPSATASDDWYSLAALAYELLCGKRPPIDIPSQPPAEARHLRASLWNTLRAGLVESGLAESSGLHRPNLQAWLRDLTLDRADAHVPSLAQILAQVHTPPRSRRFARNFDLTRLALRFGF